MGGDLSHQITEGPETRRVFPYHDIFTRACQESPVVMFKNWISIGSDNGLSPIRRQSITLTNAAVLFVKPLETNFSEILIKIQHFSFTKMHLKISSAKWRPFCQGEDEF